MPESDRSSDDPVQALIQAIIDADLARQWAPDDAATKGVVDPVAAWDRPDPPQAPEAGRRHGDIVRAVTGLEGDALEAFTAGLVRLKRTKSQGRAGDSTRRPESDSP
jgi:hypothetical protein